VDKRKAEEKTEQTLSKALAILEEWCDRNNMKTNASKTSFQSLLPSSQNNTSKVEG
jgi:hypothetical protein